MNDAPDLPLWPDHENCSNAAAADRIPTETFAFMPDWLGMGYRLRGRKGYWDPNMTGNIAQQVHYMHESSFRIMHRQTCVAPS